MDELNKTKTKKPSTSSEKKKGGSNATEEEESGEMSLTLPFDRQRRHSATSEANSMQSNKRKRIAETEDDDLEIENDEPQMEAHLEIKRIISGVYDILEDRHKNGSQISKDLLGHFKNELDATMKQVLKMNLENTRLEGIIKGLTADGRDTKQLSSKKVEVYLPS